MVIRKSDIVEISPNFSVNIESRLVDPHIRDVKDFDLSEKLDADLVKAVEVIVAKNPEAWDTSVSYETGNAVVFENKIWEALQDNASVEPVEGADWSESYLGTWWYVYLRRWAVFLSYSRFLLWAGRNATQYGLVQIFENTSTQVEGLDRAALIRDANGKASVMESKTIKAGKDVSWTFDGIIYTAPGGITKSTFGINAI